MAEDRIQHHFLSCHPLLHVGLGTGIRRGKWISLRPGPRKLARDVGRLWASLDSVVSCFLFAKKCLESGIQGSIADGPLHRNPIVKRRPCSTAPPKQILPAE